MLSSELTEESFIESLVQEIRSGGWGRLAVYEFGDKSRDCAVDVALLDGLTYESGSLEFGYLVANYDEVSFTFLLDTLRKSDLPLLGYGFDEWAAWDKKENCLRTNDNGLEWNFEFAMKRLMVSTSSEDIEGSPILKLLWRSAMALDHGIKPVLIRKESISEVLSRRQVEFVEPAAFNAQEAEDFALAYFNSGGEVVTVSFRDAMRYGVPIATRNCTYTQAGRVFRPNIGSARFLADAFAMAQLTISSKPISTLRSFRVREKGTAFNSGIERIGADLTIGSTDNCLRLPSAQTGRLAIQPSEHEEVYLTFGDHPLESKYVTTPALFSRAVKLLDSISPPFKRMQSS